MPDDVAQWLELLGLGQYAETFAAQQVLYGDLIDLTDDDLKELGMPLGPRKRLLRGIASLKSRQGDDSPPVSNRSDPAPAQVCEPSEAERRQLTVMFCDLARSTELTQRLDPEDLRQVTRAYQDVCKATIELYDGYVAR